MFTPVGLGAVHAWTAMMDKLGVNTTLFVFNKWILIRSVAGLKLMFVFFKLLSYFWTASKFLLRFLWGAQLPCSLKQGAGDTAKGRPKKETEMTYCGTDIHWLWQLQKDASYPFCTQCSTWNQRWVGLESDWVCLVQTKSKMTLAQSTAHIQAWI